MSLVADDERLFEVGPGVEAPSERGRVDKTFRHYDPHQVFLLPPSIDDWLPERHPRALGRPVPLAASSVLFVCTANSARSQLAAA